MDLPGGITILTGGRGIGKTRTCQRLAEEALKAGLKVTGLICPAVFENGEKTGIDVVNVSTGESRLLACKVNRQSGFEVTDHWDFFPEVLEWGNNILSDVKDSDLFLMDELGPLEFDQQQGWMKAFDVINSLLFKKAVVVIRPELLEKARMLWPDANLINMNT